MTPGDNYYNIPAEFRNLNQWVLFRLKKLRGKKKLSKVPYQPNGHKASATTPAEWSDFEAAHCAFDLIGGFAGIGFVFSENDPYCGIDLDGCIDPESKAIAPWALEIVAMFPDAYIEISPSGTGIHIITKAKLPGRGRREGQIEIYDQARYFTVTGNVYQNPSKGIPAQQDSIDRLLKSLRKNNVSNEFDLNAKLKGESLEDIEIKELIVKAKSAKNGEKFEQLFTGDWSGYPSQSEADMALCLILAFWTNCNEVAMDQMFRESALYRDKWDRFDYCARTIRNAIAAYQSNADEHSFEIIDVTKQKGREVEVKAPQQVRQIEFKKGAFPRTPFPLETLPEKHQAFIKKMAISFCVPVEAVALTVLTLISTATGNSTRVIVKEDWAEPVFLWAMIVGNSGCGKTPFMKKLMEPFKAKEAAEYKKYLDALEAYELEKIMFDKMKKSTKPELMPTTIPKPPKMTHCYVTDVTSEALFDIMANTPRGVQLFYDELSGFITSHDQYKNGGNDRQRFLDMWSCGPIKSHRVSKPTTYVRNAGCSILGGIQPMILPTVFSLQAFADGLLPRFLISNMTRHDNYLTPSSVSRDDMRFWDDEIQRYYAIALVFDQFGHIQHRQLQFTDAAFERFQAYHNELTQKMRFMPEQARVFIPKIRSYCARLAGILQLMHQKDSDEIDLPILENAIKISLHFAGEAMHLLRYYSKKEKRISDFEGPLLQLLLEMRSTVKNDKIELGLIVDRVNQSLLPGSEKTSNELSHTLRKLGFKTKLINGYSHLLWDEPLIKQLLNDYSDGQ